MSHMNMNEISSSCHLVDPYWHDHEQTPGMFQTWSIQLRIKVVAIFLCCFHTPLAKLSRGGRSNCGCAYGICIVNASRGPCMKILTMPYIGGACIKPVLGISGMLLALRGSCLTIL